MFFRSVIVFTTIGTYICAVNVSDADGLETQIIANTAEITFENTITYSQFFRPISTNSNFENTNDNSILIEGGGNTLSTSGNYRGLFIGGNPTASSTETGTVTIQNLTISGATAKGGDGSTGGGGGAGLGGGLFVNEYANAVVKDVRFVNCSAVGGSSTGTDPGNTLSLGGGGGGGLGGDGGAHSSVINPQRVGTGGGAFPGMEEIPLLMLLVAVVEA